MDDTVVMTESVLTDNRDNAYKKAAHTFRETVLQDETAESSQIFQAASLLDPYQRFSMKLCPSTSTVSNNQMSRNYNTTKTK